MTIGGTKIFRALGQPFVTNEGLLKGYYAYILYQNLAKQKNQTKIDEIYLMTLPKEYQS